MDNKDFDLIGTLKVRPAKEEDAVSLQMYCFPEKSKEVVADELKTDLAEESSTIRLVADSSGYAVGHISVKQHPANPEIGQISDLAVSGPFRLLGVADNLVEAAEDAAKDDGLNALQIELGSTDKVIQRYKDWGFSERPIVTLEKPLTDAGVDQPEEVDPPEEDTEEEQIDEPEAEQQTLLN